MSQHSLLAKLQWFISTPVWDVNQYKLWKDFTSLGNQLPYKAKKLQLISIQTREFKIKNIDKLFSPQPVWHARYASLRRAKGTNIRVIWHSSSEKCSTKYIERRKRSVKRS